MGRKMIRCGEVCNDRRAENKPCFADKYRTKCGILDNTYPRDVLCPFYKTEKDYNEGIRTYGDTK